MSYRETLHIFAGGKWMGRMDRDRKRNRLSFRYKREWRAHPDSFPLSLSMPLAATEHGHDAMESFLWGLLPDNEGVLRRWGERFHVSSRNPFHLLSSNGFGLWPKRCQRRRGESEKNFGNRA